MADTSNGCVPPVHSRWCSVLQGFRMSIVTRVLLLSSWTHIMTNSSQEAIRVNELHLSSGIGTGSGSPSTLCCGGR